MHSVQGQQPQGQAQQAQQVQHQPQQAQQAQQAQQPQSQYSMPSHMTSAGSGTSSLGAAAASLQGQLPQQAQQPSHAGFQQHVRSALDSRCPTICHILQHTLVLCTCTLCCARHLLSNGFNATLSKATQQRQASRRLCSP